MTKTCALVGLASLVALGSGCSAATPSDPLGTTSQNLIGGTADTGDPAVVLFDVTGTQGGDCTAEFISPTVLLTAAHCVLDDNSQPLSGVQYRIYMGNDFSQVKDSDWIYIQPSNVHYNPAYDGTVNDITVLVLDKPVNVTPLAFNTQPIAQSHVGDSTRLVGYGATVSGSAAGGANDGFGIKREETADIVGLTTNFVHIGKTGGQACDGDSGGPALMTINGVETLIGVDSYSNLKVNCTGGDYYQRVDTQLAFIMQYMTAAPSSPGSGTGSNGSGSTGSGSNSGGTAGSNGSGSGSNGGSSSGSTSGGDSSGSEEPAGGGNGSAAPSGSAGGCALTPRGGQASDAAPWAVALMFVATRRRRAARQPRRA
jgi:hypothetical protein